MKIFGVIGRAFFLAILLSFASAAFAEETGSSVVLVYNSASAESREIAMHYAEKRQVPQSQIFSFDLPTSETISRKDFDQKLRQPLWDELVKNKLFTPRDPIDPKQVSIVDAKVRYAVLCYGVPLKILPEPGIEEKIAANLAHDLRRNEAAVDSELAALPAFKMNLPLTGFVTNPEYGATNANRFHPTNGVLMVARLDGPDAQTARGLVDKAIQAETDGLWGHAYFDARGLTNGGYLIGDRWIREAAEASKLYGFDTILDNRPATFAPGLPLPNAALYFGWYDENVSGPFANGLVQFPPGAVAYHLHSFSAKTLRTTNAHWAGPLLGLGATATMGCTEEPYLQATPDINTFLRRFLFLGYSFGEAAYSSLPVLSWQITIIGDPLYRPFQKSQKERFDELENSRSKNIEWSVMMWLNYRLAQNASLTEILSYCEQMPEAQKSALIQARLAEMQKSRGKLFDALETYQGALKLPAPSMESLRIRLAAGALSSTLGKNEEAYEIYNSIIKDFPNYPAKKDVYERLAKAARKIRKTDEAAQFERLANES